MGDLERGGTQSILQLHRHMNSTTFSDQPNWPLPSATTSPVLVTSLPRLPADARSSNGDGYAARHAANGLGHAFHLSSTSTRQVPSAVPGNAQTPFYTVAPSFSNASLSETPSILDFSTSASTITRMRSGPASMGEARRPFTAASSRKAPPKPIKTSRWDVFGSVLNSKLASEAVIPPPLPQLPKQKSVRDGDSRSSSRSAITPNGTDKFKGQQMLEINIVIVGAGGVGKSTFISGALDLDPEDATPLKAKNYMINGCLCTARLFEVSAADIQILGDGKIEWPQSGEMAKTRRVDGAIILYDIMNPDSLPPVPKLLNAFKKADLPGVLVATKCDNPPSLREIDPDVVESKAKSMIEGISVFQTSHAQSEGQQLCVSTLLRECVYGQAGKPALSSVRPRSRSSSAKFGIPAALMSPRGPKGSSSYTDLHKLRHGRSSSAIQTPRSSRPVSPSYGSQYASVVASPTLSPRPRSPQQNAESRPFSPKVPLRIKTSLVIPQDVREDGSPRSFLDLEESPSHLRRISQDSHHTETQERSPEQKLATFDELVDHLLLPMHNQEPNFVPIFLAFYRIFAAPSVLLERIIDHFDSLYVDGHCPISDMDLQNRDLMIIDQWINAYPGDFAHILSRQKLREFLVDVGQETKFHALAQQIGLALDVIVVDDDTRWGYTDSSRMNDNNTHTQREARQARKNTFLSTSSVESSEPGSPSSPRDLQQRSESPSQMHRSLATAPTNLDSRLAEADTISLTRTSLGLDGTIPNGTLPKAAEAVFKQAALLVPRPLVPFTKDSWRAFMVCDDDNVARELTRIDWTMFSCIRPRDLIRHVTVPTFDRHRFRALQNVTRMTEHFNHLAYWVTNVILLRDKPKHRAQALEKMMRVARKLREYNNYNALGAVVAGIQGTSVHRLSATRELVSPAVQKDFMKLEILLSPSKSHSAYRLAWENTRSERIPFLPLHRKDLVTADQGGKTWVADGHANAAPQPGSDTSRPLTRAGGDPHSINWKKFSILGEALLSIQRAQATPYIGLIPDDVVRGLVLEGKIEKDDDELYERSVMLEAPAGGRESEVGGVRRRLAWLGKYGVP